MSKLTDDARRLAQIIHDQIVRAALNDLCQRVEQLEAVNAGLKRDNDIWVAHTECVESQVKEEVQREMAGLRARLAATNTEGDE